MTIGTTHRIGLEHLRLGGHRAAESVDREPEVVHPITEIAPDRHNGAMRSSRSNPRVFTPKANGGGTDPFGDRWLEFGEFEIDRDHARKSENHLGHVLGESLEELVLRAPREISQGDGHLAVVHRGREIVGATGFGKIDLDVDVDAQRLRGHTLVVEDSDDARDFQCFDEHMIDRSPVHRRPRYR